MSKCVREARLDEYIEELDFDEVLKKRMLDLYYREKEELKERERHLRNCDIKIEELEAVILELSIELAKAKRHIRNELN